MPIYDAAMKYLAAGVPTVIFAGEEYGTGSSRDWAAKGTQLLGIKAVVARSFERIHRSNLIGMGVLPLQFKTGVSWETLGLQGDEVVDVRLADEIKPLSEPAGDHQRRRHPARSGGDAAHRHARGRLLQARRHPALRLAAIAGRLSL
jgi:aconitase A